MNAQQKSIQEKCIAFGVKCAKLHKELIKKHEYNMSDQLERSATSIGAQYSEAAYAESDLDFVHKIQIAQKEGNEAIYWLKVLYRSEWIDEVSYQNLLSDVEEIMRILSSIVVKLKIRLKNPS